MESTRIGPDLILVIPPTYLFVKQLLKCFDIEVSIEVFIRPQILSSQEYAGTDDPAYKVLCFQVLHGQFMADIDAADDTLRSRA